MIVGVFVGGIPTWMEPAFREVRGYPLTIGDWIAAIIGICLLVLLIKYDD